METNPPPPVSLEKSKDPINKNPHLEISENDFRPFEHLLPEYAFNSISNNIFHFSKYK